MTSFNKALKYTTQRELLNDTKTTRTNSSPIFSIQYTNNTKHIAHILHKHWSIIENDPTLRILWPEPPMVAYQKNKNLKDTLVTAKLKTTQHDTIPKQQEDN
jgi:hypothetical protein